MRPRSFQIYVRPGEKSKSRQILAEVVNALYDNFRSSIGRGRRRASFLLHHDGTPSCGAPDARRDDLTPGEFQRTMRLKGISAPAGMARATETRLLLLLPGQAAGLEAPQKKSLNWLASFLPGMGI